MIAELKRGYEELKQKYKTLRQKMYEPKEQSKRIKILDQQMKSKSKESMDLISDLSSRMDTIERSISELSSLSIRRPAECSMMVNSSDFSHIPAPELRVAANSTSYDLISQVRNGKQEFLPYYIKEDYAGRDNLTVLDGNQLDLVVEIIGHYNESPIIYPFGDAIDLPSFSPMTIELSFHDADRSLNGTAYGSFKRDKSGIYQIEILELQSDGDASGIEAYTLPLTMRCQTTLYLA
jgi:hypothetical protein